jgi:hypothetical protein
MTADDAFDDAREAAQAAFRSGRITAGDFIRLALQANLDRLVGELEPDAETVALCHRLLTRFGAPTSLTLQ